MTPEWMFLSRSNPLCKGKINHSYDFWPRKEKKTQPGAEAASAAAGAIVFYASLDAQKQI
jgi:hypothetical protein